MVHPAPIIQSCVCNMSSSQVRQTTIFIICSCPCFFSFFCFVAKKEVLGHLGRDPVVSYIRDAMSEEIGPRVYRFKAEVAWNSDALVDRWVGNGTGGTVWRYRRYSLAVQVRCRTWAARCGVLSTGA